MDNDKVYMYVERNQNTINNPMLADSDLYRIVIQHGGTKLMSGNIMDKDEAQERLDHLIVGIKKQLAGAKVYTNE